MVVKIFKNEIRERTCLILYFKRYFGANKWIKNSLHTPVSKKQEGPERSDTQLRLHLWLECWGHSLNNLFFLQWFCWHLR
jgi:hypothetical protein